MTANERLQLDPSTTAALLEGLPEAALVLTATGRIEHENRLFTARIRGGRPGADLVELADDPDAARRAIALWAGSSTSRPARLRIGEVDVRGDGARLAAAPDHLVVRFRAGERANDAFRDVSRAVDIGALERTKDRLRDALREVEQTNAALRVSNEMLERFAGVISHDLRTPLAGIIGVSDMLQADVEDPGTKELVAIVVRNATRMRRQIDGLLTLARAGASRPPGRTDATQAMDAVLGLLAAEIADHGAAVEVVAPLPVLPTTEAEAVQLLQNLVQNAVTHAAAVTAAPHVRVTGGSDDTAVWLSVEDDGGGIPVDERERVLEPFGRGSDVVVPGSGIGLAACVAIVTGRGGSLRIGDSPLGGADIRVVFPVGGSDAPSR